MFKIDKTTHLAILFTFALAFIVIYLYYTISDVRKVQLELKKTQDEMVGLQKLISTISGGATGATCPITPVTIPPQVATVHVDVKSISNENASPIDASVAVADVGANAAANVGANVEADEEESVTSEEMQHILDAASDNEAEDVSNTVDVPTEAPMTTVASVASVASVDFSNLKYDELRDLCKKHNLSTKGTREVLLARVMEGLAH